MNLDSNIDNYNEITWDTISDYLCGTNEIAIPLHRNEKYIMIVKPNAYVELQIRTDEAFQTDIHMLPDLIRLRYNNFSAKSYKCFAIISDLKEFDDTVLKFFNSIAFNLIIEKQSVDESIRNAYENWKKMLTRSKIPDENALVGIWGELYIIEKLSETINEFTSSIIQNWTGPLGAANDFSFGNSCIEIKTTTKQSNIVEISSIDQLDAENPWIILLHVFHSPIDSGGKTIKMLVENICLTLDSTCLDIFKNRIQKILDISELSKLDHFSLKIDGEPFAIKVDNTFPVLTRSHISSIFHSISSNMLCNVKYSLNLSDKLSNSIKDIPELFKKILL